MAFQSAVALSKFILYATAEHDKIIQIPAWYIPRKRNINTFMFYD